MEPFTRLFFLQDCEKRLTFAASIFDTTSRLVLQMHSGGNFKSTRNDKHSTAKHRSKEPSIPLG